jgi:hypothetical protein
MAFDNPFIYPSNVPTNVRELRVSHFPGSVESDPEISGMLTYPKMEMIAQLGLCHAACAAG